MRVSGVKAEHVASLAKEDHDKMILENRLSEGVLQEGHYNANFFVIVQVVSSLLQTNLVDQAIKKDKG